MSKTPLLVVCSPHPRTGTSTVTRLLADYMTIEERSFALFDTDPHSRALGDWFPESCLIADLSSTRGQIALFDTLVSPGPQTRIVEVSSPIYSRFFSQALDIGLFEEAVKSDLEPIVLFLSDGSDTSVHAAGALESSFRQITLMPVVNQGPVRLGPRIHDHLDAFKAAHSFLIPALDTSARDVIEQPRFSLSRFLSAPPPESMSLVVRADLRNWIKRAFMQFHAYEVRKAFDESSYLLAVGTSARDPLRD